MSLALLQEKDGDNGFNHYWFAAMVFISIMTDLNRVDEVLATLEDLLPGVSSPEHQPQSLNEHGLKYYFALTKEIQQSTDEYSGVLDSYETIFKGASIHSSKKAASLSLIELARGNRKAAIDLALEDLGGGRRGSLSAWDWPLRFQHINLYKELAKEPAVAKRLKELEDVASKSGEDIWAYIVENDLQL